MDSEEAFLAGLLHDIGMVVMDHVMRERYHVVLEKAMRQEAPLNQLEREAWGFDHADVGAWLGEHWKFPEPLLEAIGCHHRVASRSNASGPLVAVIHLADYCCNEAGLTVSGKSDCFEPQEEALKLAGISEPDLVDLSERMRGERPQIEAFFTAMST